MFERKARLLFWLTSLLGNPLLVGTLVAQGVAFRPAQHFPVGNAVESVQVGDFNGDEIPDLAVTTAYSSNVFILLGTGDGTFGAAQGFPAARGRPWKVAIGDFNGDQRQDLVVPNAQTNQVAVLLGVGDGTFRPAQNFDVGSNPHAVAVADFDGDEMPDVAVANMDSNNVSILLGNGDGTFRAPQAYEVGNGPIGVAVADFNGDALPDLAVAHGALMTRPYFITILFGNGDGTFRTPQALPVPHPLASLTVADLNGDAIPDLVAANGDGYCGHTCDYSSVSIWLGQGDGTFGPTQTVTAGRGPIAVAVADFNGDGIPDLAAGNWGHYECIRLPCHYVPDNTVSIRLGYVPGDE